MEIKATPHFIKSIDDRTVTGIFAVHGNVDSGYDRSHPGAFAKTISERGGDVRFLWGHDFMSPPVAKIDSLRELSRDELTTLVLGKAPEATGGVEVVRTYLDTPRGNEILAGVKSGAISEMSYAYDALQFDFEEADGKQVRNLRQVKLYEVSDVNFGMNPATQGAKGLDVFANIAAYLAAFKAGARHSGGDTALINQIVENAIALGATNAKLITADDATKTEQPTATPASVDLISLRNALHKIQIQLA